MGAEALALHLEGLAADGEAAPEPSSLEEIMKDAQNKDGVAVLIAAPAAEVKSVRINVTMPADVLDQIDRYAEREGFTRSGFLAQAAKKAMASLDQVVAELASGCCRIVCIVPETKRPRQNRGL